MTFDLKHILASMGPVAVAIAMVLVVMAIASAGVAVERVWMFRKSRAATKRFIKAIQPHFDVWDVDAAYEVTAEHRASALARLMRPVLRRYLNAHATDTGGGLSPAALARKEAERASEAVGAHLRKGMSVLASVGSVAPFVGLLGTVVGIIGAFQGIASKGAGGLGAVSAGIAEALIETAFGLMVAIPAVLLFNYLTGRVATIERRIQRSVGELLDDMENQDGRTSETRIKRAA